MTEALPYIHRGLLPLNQNPFDDENESDEICVGSMDGTHVFFNPQFEEDQEVVANGMLQPPTSLVASPNFDSATTPSVIDNASFSGENESSEERTVKSLDFEENTPRESAQKRSKANPFEEKKDNGTTRVSVHKAEEQHKLVNLTEVKVTGENGISPFPEVNGRFEVKEKIGEGTFSSVYKAQCFDRKAYGISDSESFIALKRIYPSCSPLRILNEMQHLKRLGGKCHVLPLYGTLRFRDQVTLVVPYVPHDKFKDFVLTISLEEMKRYMKALFESLKHLHANGVIHRDIKPGNFLCNFKEDRFMLVDFGLAELVPSKTSNGVLMEQSFGTSATQQSNITKQLDNSLENFRKRKLEEISQQIRPSLLDNPKLAQNAMLNFRRCTSVESMTLKKSHQVKQKVLHAPRAGTRGFRAPEILLKCQNQTTAIDVWSAGVIFLCILSTRYPFFNSPDDLASLAEIAAVFGTKEVTLAAESLGRRVRFPTEITRTELSIICKKLSPQRTFAIPETAFDLLSRCLDLNPMTRISAADALLHPFFSNNIDSIRLSTEIKGE